MDDLSKDILSEADLKIRHVDEKSE
jgi:hypothetical protein